MVTVALVSFLPLRNLDFRNKKKEMSRLLAGSEMGNRGASSAAVFGLSVLLPPYPPPPPPPNFSTRLIRLSQKPPALQNREVGDVWG